MIVGNERYQFERGWTVTVWVDAPADWNAERVREEVDAVLGGARLRTDLTLTLNTVHTPKPEKGLNDEK